MTPYQVKQLHLMRQMEERFTDDPHAASTVPMQLDYISDRQMCLTVNSFIPDAIANRIQSMIIEPMRRVDPTHYYYDNASLHITIHTVRTIHYPPTFTDNTIETSKSVLARYIPKNRPFRFRLIGIMAIPTSVAVIAIASARYNRFTHVLRRAFTAEGIPDEKKYFSPDVTFANVTVCRYTHMPSPEFLKTLTSLKTTPVGSVTVGEVALLETNAGAHPSKTRIFATYPFPKTQARL